LSITGTATSSLSAGLGAGLILTLPCTHSARSSGQRTVSIGRTSGSLPHCVRSDPARCPGRLCHGECVLSLASSRFFGRRSDRAP
jgi:hypothetical protein